MIGLAQVYFVAGLVFAASAVLSARDPSNPKRWVNAAFWGLLALSMLVGDRLGDLGNGALVIALVGVAALGGLGRGAVMDDNAARQQRAARHGNRLFLLALVIPVTALAGTLLFKPVPWLVDPKQVTLVSLALGALLALGMGWSGCVIGRLQRCRKAAACSMQSAGRQSCRRCWRVWGWCLRWPGWARWSASWSAG